MSLLTGFDLCRAALAVNGVTATEQSVLTTLAIMANGDAQCWPGISGLVARTKLSERTVQRAVQGLKDAGHLNWVDKPGRGRIYIVHPRHSDTPKEATPVAVAPRQSDTPVTVTPTPVTVTPKQPRTTNTSPVASQPTRARAPANAEDRYHRLPTGWSPTKALPDKLQAKVAQWPPGKVSDELEALHRWAANASNDRGKGRKLNWDIAWENWLDRADNDWRSKNGPVRLDRGSAPRTSDGFLNAIRESGERRRAANC